MHIFSDKLKERERRVGKKNKNKKVEDVKQEACTVEDEEEYFEDAPPFDENSSFYQMNLSRPLMKVIEKFKFYVVHSTIISIIRILILLIFLEQNNTGYRCFKLCPSYSDPSGSYSCCAIRS